MQYTCKDLSQRSIGRRLVLYIKITIIIIVKSYKAHASIGSMRPYNYNPIVYSSSLQSHPIKSDVAGKRLILRGTVNTVNI